MHRVGSLMLVVILIAAACAGDVEDDSAPTIAMASSELQAWETASVAFFDRSHEAYPDLDRVFAEYAADAVFYDPTFGDYFIGPEQIVRGWAQMPGAFPDLDTDIQSAFLATDGAAIVAEWVNLWLGEKPPELPWPAGLEVFRFRGDEIAESEIWYTIETLEGPMHSCAGCAVDLRSLADSYVARWSSRDAGEIAALYSEDAIVLDSMFAIEADGAVEIGELAAVRYGSGDAIARAGEPFGMLLDARLIGADSGAAAGDIVGVGVQFSWSAAKGAPTVDSLALLYFGRVNDGVYEAHPANLIVEESVFHDPTSLMALNAGRP